MPLGDGLHFAMSRQAHRPDDSAIWLTGERAVGLPVVAFQKEKSEYLEGRLLGTHNWHSTLAPRRV